MVGLSSATRVRQIVLLAVAVFASGLLFVSTSRWGLGVSYDSVVYVQASHHLGSIPLPQSTDQGGKALFWWAPGYPLVLAAFGGDYSGARLLNTLLLFLGVLLVAGVAWKAVGPREGVVAGALYGLSPAVFSVHAAVLAEPLFLLLITAALWLIAMGRSVSAGVATGAATLTRYAGLPLVLVGGLMLHGRERWRFLAVSLSMYAAWLIRNEFAAGELTGRKLRWHPPTWHALGRAPPTVLHFVVTPGQLQSIQLHVNAGAIAQVIAALALGSCLLRFGRERPPRLVTVGALFAAFYVTFLVLTATFFDDLTPLDQRLLVPIVPPLVIAIAWLLRRQPVAAVILICVFAVATVQQARTFRLYGEDYSGAVWNRARMPRSALPDGQLYSPWPAAVAYFTGRSPRRMPNPFDEHTRMPNPHFYAEQRRLTRAVNDGKASVVLLDGRFLEIPTNGTPASALPRSIRDSCRSITSVVVVCTRRG